MTSVEGQPRDYGRGTPSGRVPVQNEATNSRRGGKPPGSVTWDEHVEAWTEYHRQHWGQDADTIALRGGFGFWELTDLLGHALETWEPRP